NTIYLGHRRPRVRGRKKEIYKFDATELLALFGGDGSPEADSGNRRRHGKEKQKDGEEQAPAAARTEEEGEPQKQQVKSPFIWARDVPLDRLCICEMGAK